MRRGLLSLAAAGGVTALAACGSAELVVQAQADGEGGEPTPLAQLEVRALPYDRDAIFDSLRTAHADPEPEIPDSLTDLQSRIAQAQQDWREAETRWNTARDSLRSLLEIMEGMARNSPRYRVAFLDYGDQEAREQSAGRQSQEAFEVFESLQQSYNTQVEQLTARRQQWADLAYVDVSDVIAARLEQLGLEEVTDTADAEGVVRFSLKPGQWWVHARYDLMFDELYWNVPVDAQRGEPISVTLDRSTAQIRPQF